MIGSSSSRHSATTTSGGASGDRIVSMGTPSAQMIEKAQIARLKSAGIRGGLRLKAKGHNDAARSTPGLVPGQLDLGVTKDELAVLGRENHRRPAKIAVTLRVERRPEDAPQLQFMGSIDEAQFFAAWNLVLEYKGRKLVLSWSRKRFPLSPCPKKVGDLVAVLARHLELAPLAAVPRPDLSRPTTSGSTPPPPSPTGSARALAASKSRWRSRAGLLAPSPSR